MRSGEKPIHAELSYKVNGILFKIHNELGRYRNEQQYSDAIEHYFRNSGIIAEREKVLPISFEGEMPGRNKVDFLVEGKIILEIKAKSILAKEDYYQTKRYLVASGKKLAILVNFRDTFLRPRRVLNPQAKDN